MAQKQDVGGWQFQWEGVHVTFPLPCQQMLIKHLVCTWAVQTWWVSTDKALLSCGAPSGGSLYPASSPTAILSHCPEHGTW